MISEWTEDPALTCGLAHPSPRLSASNWCFFKVEISIRVLYNKTCDEYIRLTIDALIHGQTTKANKEASVPSSKANRSYSNRIIWRQTTQPSSETHNSTLNEFFFSFLDSLLLPCSCGGSKKLPKGRLPGACGARPPPHARVAGVRVFSPGKLYDKIDRP